MQVMTTEERAERRSSVENKHKQLERKYSGNSSERHERLKRTSLERRSSSGDRLSVTPDNLSPNPSSSPAMATAASKEGGEEISVDVCSSGACTVPVNIKFTKQCENGNGTEESQERDRVKMVCRTVH